jgi:hypothetical protein
LRPATFPATTSKQKTSERYCGPLEDRAGPDYAGSMNLPRKHHYNPQFALRRWVGSDGRLCAMRRINGVVTPRRRQPSRTGMLRDLYRIEGVAEESSQDLEIKFMSPLDNVAAVVLDRLITGKPLDPEQRLAWARYLLSMLFRNPDTSKPSRRTWWRLGVKASTHLKRTMPQGVSRTIQRRRRRG